MNSSSSERTLASLCSVGPATLKDLSALGITTVSQLEDADADNLYDRLCHVTGKLHDPCCRDVFAAAIAQARDPHLPEQQRKWWYWSRLRKGRGDGKDAAAIIPTKTASRRRPGQEN